MVRAVRQGQSMRAAARHFGVALSTVQRWMARAAGQRLDRVDWSAQSRRPRRTTRASKDVEDLVLQVRESLRDESVLGHYGAEAILEKLRARRVDPLPSRATIVRIIRRRGALDPRRRVRRPSPPRGWYLSAVRRAEAELDSFDFIEGLRLHGGPRLAVLTGISLHGGLPAAFPRTRRQTKDVCRCLVRHWKRHGLPTYAQFDNDTVFQGAHHHPDAIGRVTRLCLSLGVTVVFAPPREHGPQNMIEGFNGQWETKVWHRFDWESLRDLGTGSNRYVAALRRHRAARIEAAPPRRPFPADWKFDVDAPVRGTVIFLRRLDDEGRAYLLGRRFQIDAAWSHQLVRVEVQLARQQIVCWGLSRQHPARHIRLKKLRYNWVQKPFRQTRKR